MSFILFLYRYDNKKTRVKINWSYVNNHNEYSWAICLDPNICHPIYFGSMNNRSYRYCTYRYFNFCSGNRCTSQTLILYVPVLQFSYRYCTYRYCHTAQILIFANLLLSCLKQNANSTSLTIFQVTMSFRLFIPGSKHFFLITVNKRDPFLMVWKPSKMVSKIKEVTLLTTDMLRIVFSEYEHGWFFFVPKAYH